MRIFSTLKHTPLSISSRSVQKYTRPKILQKQHNDAMEANFPIFPNNLLHAQKLNLYKNLKPNEIPHPDRPRGNVNDPINARKKREKDRETKARFTSMKSEISQEETQRRIEHTVTQERGGTVEFDGGLNEGWDDIMKRIENIAPQAYYSHTRAINKDGSEWLYDMPLGILDRKPGEDFEKESLRSKRKWREGSFMSVEKQKEIWKNTLATLPIFRKKPADPFRSYPQLISRISYKDPQTLAKFLSRGGRILHPRYTGVRWKTQRKIKREIHKARYFGLFPFSGNPLWQQTEHQPAWNRERDLKRDWLDRLMKKKIEFKHWIKNLEAGIQITGDDKWLPPKARQNPQYGAKILGMEIKGHMADQLDIKTEEIAHFERLDDTLVPLRKIINQIE